MTCSNHGEYYFGRWPHLINGLIFFASIHVILRTFMGAPGGLLRARCATVFLSAEKANKKN